MRVSNSTFYRRLQLADGSAVLGLITGYPQQRVDLEYPLRRITVPRRAELVPGQEIITEMSERYLICDEGVDYVPGADAKTFTLIRLTEEGFWKRPTTVQDSVTGLQKNSGTSTDLGSIWYHVRRLKMDTDVVRVPEARDEVTCGAELVVGDLLGSYIILTTEKRLGVTVAQVRGG